jgi:hypothetical protein
VSPEGTGLGLSLSHDIVVKQHNGALEWRPSLASTRDSPILISGHRRDLTLLAELTAGGQIRVTQVLEAAATCVQMFDLRP